MALTFGTLLSSQGADAHHPGPLRPFRGNPRNFTGQIRSSQTRAPPASRLVAAHEVPRGASRLGDVRLGSASAWPVGLRPSNKENISQSPDAESNRVRAGAHGDRQRAVVSECVPVFRADPPPAPPRTRTAAHPPRRSLAGTGYRGGGHTRPRTRLIRPRRTRPAPQAPGRHDASAD